jgi:N-succinyldiaminopimelate aminotransferase
MGARTVTISSLGKTFSVTGWKVGWAIGAQALVQAVNQAHQFITFAVATPLQAAAVAALDLPEKYYAKLRADYQLRRDRMIDVLTRVGFKVFKPEGSYFIIADWRAVAPQHIRDDVEFTRWLIERVGVACIPPSFFYRDPDRKMGRYMARFAVCKRDETLDAAAERLSRLGK